MAKRTLSKNNLKAFLAIAGILIVAEIVVLVIFQDDGADETKLKAIEKAVDKVPNVDEARRVQMKVQMALNDYMTKNSGKPPAVLEVLQADYFPDGLPVDPKTNKPFKYRVDGVRYFLGEESAPTPKPGANGTPGIIGPSDGPSDQAELINMLSADLTPTPYVPYDATGKRDPFQRFDLAPTKSGVDCVKDPLRCIDPGQLRVTAVLGTADNATAFVETGDGKGYSVKKGMLIGASDAQVVEIQQDKVLLLETTVDFTGEKKTNTIEMRLRTKDQEKSVMPGPTRRATQ